MGLIFVVVVFVLLGLGVWLIVADYRPRSPDKALRPQTREEQMALHQKQRLAALQIKALALLPIAMRGNGVEDLRAEMADNLERIAAYRTAMRAALQTDALDDQEAEARSHAIRAAREKLLTSFGNIHTRDAVILLDSALCLPPIPAELGF